MEREAAPWFASCARFLRRRGRERPPRRPRGGVSRLRRLRSRVSAEHHRAVAVDEIRQVEGLPYEPVGATNAGEESATQIVVELTGEGSDVGLETVVDYLAGGESRCVVVLVTNSFPCARGERPGPMMDTDLGGRVALVTGSSRGIRQGDRGRAGGARSAVVLSARGREDLERAAAEADGEASTADRAVRLRERGRDRGAVRSALRRWLGAVRGRWCWPRSAQGSPLGRMGEAEEMAAAINFLCTDAACYVHGALSVDGGNVGIIV